MSYVFSCLQTSCLRYAKKKNQSMQISFHFHFWCNGVLTSGVPLLMTGYTINDDSQNAVQNEANII